MSWNPFERRPAGAKSAYVDPKTGEPVAKLVIDNTGSVVGSAETPSEAAHVATEAAEDFKAAA